MRSRWSSAHAIAPIPCTPAGILELLGREGIPLQGTRAVVVGRSSLVGKPVSLQVESQYNQEQFDIVLM